MSIDTSILPTQGSFSGISYSRRISDLINTSGYILTDATTGRKSRYNANCYTSYIGGQNRLNTGHSFAAWDSTSNTLTITQNIDFPRAVNISLICNDWGENEGRFQSENRRATDAGGAGYNCPVVSFNPNNICLNVVAVIANVGTSDMEDEDFTLSSVDFYNVMTDSVYEGIYDNGVSNDGRYYLYGWYVDIYVGTETNRTRTNRVGIMIESAAPTATDATNEENYYFYYGNANYINTFNTRRLNNSTWESPSRDYSQGYGIFANRKYDSASWVLDSSGGYFIETSDIVKGNFSRGYGTIPDTHLFYKWSRWGNEPLIFGFLSGEEVLKNVAAFGLFFTLIASKAQSATIGAGTTDDGVHLGVINSDGYTDGSWVSGTDCGAAVQSTWTDAVTSAETAGYTPLDPTQPVPGTDPTNYDPDNTTIFPTYGVSAGTENVYALEDLEMTAALKYIYGDAFTTSDAMYSVKNFLTTNPIDTIHSLFIFPLAITPTLLPSQQSLFSATDYINENVAFGNVTTDVSSKRLLRRTGLLDLGYIDVYEKNKNFLDYSPYTSIMLYLPFCGLISLDCDKYMGHRIYIKYIIDVTTGGCTACILRDNLMTETVNGQIGIQVPLTGIQSAQVQAAIDGAQLTYKQQSQATALSLAAMTIGAGVTVASGGAALPLLGAAGNAALSVFSGASRAAENREYQLSHIMTPFKTVGGSNSAIGAQMELTPRLYISRPRMLESYDAETFARLRGNACLISSNLAAFSGFTQVSAADLSAIPASAAEKSKLMQLLQAGIIL